MHPAYFLPRLGYHSTVVSYLTFIVRFVNYSMCYDISFTVKLKEIGFYFPELADDPQLRLDFEGVHIMGHSYSEHPVIYRDAEKKLKLRGMEWGCIPFYVKDEKQFLRQRESMLNARSERILGDEKSYWFNICF